MDIFNKEITAETMPLRICVNCKHCGTNASGNVAAFKCFSPNNPSTINLVSGAKNYTVTYCESQRASTLRGTCGQQGLWFEQAPPKQALVPTPQVEIGTGKMKVKLAGGNLADMLGM